MRGRTFSEELERFVNSRVSIEDVVENSWAGFAEFTIEIGNVEPSEEEDWERVREVALE